MAEVVFWLSGVVETGGGVTVDEVGDLVEGDGDVGSAFVGAGVLGLAVVGDGVTLVSFSMGTDGADVGMMVVGLGVLATGADVCGLVV